MPEAAPHSTTPLVVLGFDFGLRRIGVAVGNTLTGTSQPRPAVHRTNRSLEPVLAAIALEVRDLQPARLIVGTPYNVDGSAHALAEAAAEFAAQLQKRFGLAVHRVDERYSSLEAESGLRASRQAGRSGRIRHGEVDSAAAAIIVERWLKGEGDR